MFGDDAYPTLEEQGRGPQIDRPRPPLIDGNKRLGWLATVVVYGRNGVALDAPEHPAHDLVIGIAEGRIYYRAAVLVGADAAVAG